jgi:hypothetical protein
LDIEELLLETERFTQTLNSQQFEQALAILRREQQAYTASSRQERIFKFLNIAIWMQSFSRRGGVYPRPQTCANTDTGRDKPHKRSNKG